MVNSGTADDVDVWRAIFASPGTVFCILTDEELAAVHPVNEASASPQPWLRARSDLSPEMAAEVGSRSLAVRGLIEVDGDQPRVDPALRLAVQARDVSWEAWSVVDVDTHEALRGSRLAELGVVVETISAEGFHAYSTATPEAVIDEIVQWALRHEGAEPYQAGAARVVAANDWDSFVRGEFDEGRFGAEARRLDMSWWPPGSEEALSWALACDSDIAVLARPTDGQHLLVEPVDRARLIELAATHWTGPA